MQRSSGSAATALGVWVFGLVALGCDSRAQDDDPPAQSAPGATGAGAPAAASRGAPASAGQQSVPVAPISGGGGGPGTGSSAGKAGAATTPPVVPVSRMGGSTGSTPQPNDAGTSTRMDAAPPPEPVTCPATALTPGDHTGMAQSEGRSRTFVLHVPRGYSGREPVALVFDFHGYGSSGSGQMRASGFRELSDEHGFVGVYPDGVGGSWHVNGCCGQAAQAKLDEVAAVRAILVEVEKQVCVDRARIYASGISQGGGMAHHVACLAADVFAAVAPVSSDLRTDPCKPSRPISELSIRGTADTLSAYEGGPVGPAGMQYQSIGAKPTLERWRTIDECTGTPEKTLELCETYAQCKAGVEVTLCTLPGAGHVLYNNPSNFDVAAAAWAMFERQRL